MMQPTYILAARSACHMACQLARRATRRAAIRLAVGSALLALPGLPLAPGALASQNVSDLLTAGDRESAARRTRAALDNFERAVQAEPTSYPALWKAAREAVDLGEFEANVETRTALYRRATDYARRAVLANTNEAEGHFQLSRAVGRTALAANPRERVSYSREVREEALKALQLFPKHPGALHVLGVWNAEVMRLNKLGTFSMAQLGQSKSAIASFMKKRKEAGGAGFQDAMLMLLNTLPTVLKYLPVEKAQDARSFMLSFQYWLGGTPDNLRNFLLMLADKYVFPEGEDGRPELAIADPTAFTTIVASAKQGLTS